MQATGAMDLSEYKNAEAWEAKMIKLIPNYEKVKILMIIDGCTVDQHKVDTQL